MYNITGVHQRKNKGVSEKKKKTALHVKQKKITLDVEHIK